MGDTYRPRTSLNLLTDTATTKETQDYGHQATFKSNSTILKLEKTYRLDSHQMAVEIDGHFLKVNKKNQLELDKEPAPKEYKNLGFSSMMEYGSWMF